MENWKDIPGFEGLYQVSNEGQIKALKRKMFLPQNGGWIDRKEMILKPYLRGIRKGREGYLVVKLYKENNKYYLAVHRAVAMAFIPNPKNKPQINHINNQRTDNNVNNLKWVTQSENMRHDYKTGIRNMSILEKHPRHIHKMRMGAVNAL